MNSITLATAALVAALSGCATAPSVARSDEIKIERGGCFGFCPVYRLEVDRNIVRFKGLRHTGLLGDTAKPANAATVTAIKAQLAPYRPSAGSAVFACTDASSDQATYTITWENLGGGDRPSLTFDSGCQAAEARTLRAILEAIPSRLNLEQESRQVTRPGAARG